MQLITFYKRYHVNIFCTKYITHCLNKAIEAEDAF